jgi:hypothetical protein
MSNKSEAVKKWRHNCKKRIVESFGGKCCLCDYDKCLSSLSLHHLDPSKKDFSLGSIRANPKNWKEIVVEIKKCVLVCNNCHGEIHSGLVLIPEDAPKFNEDFSDYKLLEKEIVLTPCLGCQELKPEYKKYCSRSCVLNKFR